MLEYIVQDGDQQLKTGKIVLAGDSVGGETTGCPGKSYTKVSLYIFIDHMAITLV